MERYETYKDSGVEWIGEIPADWTIAPLKTLASIVAGQSPSNDDVADEGSLPFLQGKAEFGTLHPFPVHYCDRPKKVADEGSILMSVRAPVGEINVADQAYGIGRGLCAIEPETIDSVFLRYALSVSDSALRSYATGSTFEAVTAGQIGNLPVAVPNSKLDSTIADYLDTKTAEIDALVTDCEREVGLLREFRKAIISEAVTKGLDTDAPMRGSGIEWIGAIPENWAILPFKAVASVVANLQHPNDYPGLPQVAPDRIEKDTGRLLPCPTVDEVGVESDNHLFDSGVVLYSKVRPALNKVTIAPFDGMCSADMYPIRTSHNHRWLMYYMLSNAFMEQVIVSTDRVKMPKVNKEELGVFKVVLPPDAEQEQIVAFLDAKTAEIDSLIDAKQSMADRLREYRKSLISEAVTGKFKVPGA